MGFPAKWSLFNVVKDYEENPKLNVTDLRLMTWSYHICWHIQTFLMYFTAGWNCESTNQKGPVGSEVQNGLFAISYRCKNIWKV